MIFLIIFLLSIILSIILNIVTLKIIGILDYDILGLHNKTISIIKIYKYVFRNKKLLIKILLSSLIFIIFNCIILKKIYNNFSFLMVNNYLKYYFVFLIIYVFAFIDFITCYVYSVLSYPVIVISLLSFLLSFTESNSFKDNMETLILVGLFYVLIKKFKFLGEGDFDIILIISLTLGVLPTVFIFYISVIISGFVGLCILIKESFKIRNNKMAFLPFIFIATFVFIILGF